MRRVASISVIVVLGVAVVSGEAASTPPNDTTCKRAAALNGGQGLRIPARGGTVWALPLGAAPASVETPLKIVWRVTGTGNLKVRLESPDGKRVPLAAEPTRHTSSSFQRPGAEYGTIFEFDQRGCWTIRLTRATTAATVRLSVT
jgi:hypothetical protein